MHRCTCHTLTICFCCSAAKLCPTPCDPMDCTMTGLPVLHYIPEFAQTISFESVMLSNRVILCHCLLFLHSLFPSLMVFATELALCISWPKYWSFSVNPSNEYSRLISFRIDRFDLLAVQRILKSLLQQHNSKTTVLQHSAFMVQLSHPYMSTGKTIALIIWTLVSKMMSLLFNILSRFVTAFLLRSKHLLIACMQSPSLGIL